MCNPNKNLKQKEKLEIIQHFYRKNSALLPIEYMYFFLRFARTYAKAVFHRMLFLCIAEIFVFFFFVVHCYCWKMYFIRVGRAILSSCNKNAQKAFVWRIFLVSNNGQKLLTTWISRVWWCPLSIQWWHRMAYEFTQMSDPLLTLNYFINFSE